MRVRIERLTDVVEAADKVLGSVVANPADVAEPHLRRDIDRLLDVGLFSLNLTLPRYLDGIVADVEVSRANGLLLAHINERSFDIVLGHRVNNLLLSDPSTAHVMWAGQVHALLEVVTVVLLQQGARPIQPAD